MKKIKFIIIATIDSDGKKVIGVYQHRESYQAALYLNYAVVGSDTKENPNNLNMRKPDVDEITMLDD